MSRRRAANINGLRSILLIAIGLSQPSRSQLLAAQPPSLQRYNYDTAVLLIGGLCTCHAQIG